MYFYLVINALAILTSLGCVKTKVPLHVGGILGSTGDSWSKYANFYNILFKVAFDEINKTDILPNHELIFVSKNSEANPGLAAKRLFEHVNEQPEKIAILGPPKSNPYQIVGQITPKFNLVQMSFLAKTSKIKDRSLYSSTFMTNYIEDDLNPARLAMINHFKWTKVATLFYNEDIFVSQMDEFHKLLGDNNVTLVTSGLITDVEDGLDLVIRRLKHFEARIIIGAFRSTKAPHIFCEVYKQKLFGKKYVWILTDSLYASWISKLKEGETSCSVENIKTAAHGHFTLGQKQLRTDQVVTISGRTAKEYNTWIKNISTQYDSNTMRLSMYSPWAYDAAWALAIGLNNSMKYMGSNSLEDFSYNRSDIYDSIQRGMNEVLFQGVSGAVSFNNGRRVGPAFIQINYGNDRRDVAMYEPLNDSIDWWESPNSLFHGGVVPRDSFQYIRRRYKQSYTVLSIVALLITVGVTVALGFLWFNVYYRNNRNIKMSSPRMNNTIIGGGLLIYIAVIFMSVDYSESLPYLNQHICMLNVWIVSIGFTLGFGALFSKTFRVHILFTQGSVKKQTIKDAHLFGLLGVLVLLDIIFLTLWTIFHPLHLLERSVSVELEDSDTVLIETYHVCYNEYQSYWLSAQYISKGGLLALGTFLAWETRHIKVPSLNDSKYIGFCVYNIIIVCALCVPVTFVLPPEKPTTKFVFTSVVCIFTTTLVLCILFVPKVKLRKSTDPIRFNTSMPKPNNLYKNSESKMGDKETKTTNISAVEDFRSDFKEKNFEKNVFNVQNNPDLKIIAVESEKFTTSSVSEIAELKMDTTDNSDLNCTSV
ncbi:gamma-aminobutyric acid type B receptor subunit 2-like [Ostrea edulis]|uniref:gamma-aminobutyric acid type B receptor subunit 2-like n=1 Tax=Ostrea edulis TaxID=37623 RepID=UPI0024AF6B70|nr:gamma-aminobutyric acid type B receptor subunit 2-like [Ostrea edulis]